MSDHCIVVQLSINREMKENTIMDNEIFFYTMTYVFSRLAIVATIGYLIYMALRPGLAVSHVQEKSLDRR